MIEKTLSDNKLRAMKGFCYQHADEDYFSALSELCKLRTLIQRIAEMDMNAELAGKGSLDGATAKQLIEVCANIEEANEAK